VWHILTKALQAIPSEHFGIKDEEERYRKRYLDILLDEELRELFVKKAKFWEVSRAFMVDNGFLEVETPTLEVTTGGAEARPFKTHHNDFDMSVYMRICIGELWQKRLMAAGYPKTFEVGRAYRNEGSSPEHLQEFTNLEFYWAYADYKDGMKLVQELYRTIAKEVFGTTKFEMRGHSFDLDSEWVEIDYVDTIKEKTGVDVITATEKEMSAKLDELEVKYDGENRERLTDTLWKYCRKQIAGPAFLVNHPKLVAPLAKTREGTETVEMFQPIIAGSEVGRGYSELNDPDEQRARFEVQKKLLEAGDEEAMMADFEFVEMLEYGMPPTCGFGFGERLFAFLAGKPLRETQFFPLMRQKLDIE
jgi:lysyl-tRNA synthetase class 2